MITFPYGYAGALLTIEQYEAKLTWQNGDPEFRRRVRALMGAAHAAGVPLGVGTLWRAYQPDKPGFASNGNSNHQSFEPPHNAVAADMVPSSSWDWMEANVARFGLRTFRYLKEPWHIQPAEIPASRNWRKERWTLQHFELPGEQPPPPSPVERFTLNVTKSYLRAADRVKLRENAESKSDVTLCQALCNGVLKTDLALDGDYGPKTVEAAKQYQLLSHFSPNPADHLKADGEWGPKTWAAVLNAA